MTPMIKKIKIVLFELFKKVYSLVVKTPLKMVPNSAKIANVIFRSIWPYQNIMDIQGSKMFINLDERNPGLRQTFQAYAMNGIHEKETTSLFKKIVRPGDIFLDLGANIGYFSLLASRLVGSQGKIFSFEPEPNNFYYLKKNIEINRYDNIYPFDKAVSNINEKIPLFICDYDSGHHTIKQYGGVKVYSHGRRTEERIINVDAVRLDDFLRNKVEKVDIVKMDIEGAEALAIEGMKNILRGNKDIKIIMEFFPLFIEKMGNSPVKLIETIKNEMGLNIFVVGHDYSMKKEKSDFLEIRKAEDLMSLVKEKEDHLNLYLTRDKFVI